MPFDLSTTLGEPAFASNIRRVTMVGMETRLVIEPRLVPAVLWGHSACKLLESENRRHDWRAVRADVLARAGHRCETCGHRQRRWMVCDEIWSYDVVTLTATLDRLRVLCPLCDAVCHFGFTMRVRGDKAAEAALRHMARVNRTTLDEAEKAICAAWERWTGLSDIPCWRVRVADELAARYPPLRIVESDLVTAA